MDNRNLRFQGKSRGNLLTQTGQIVISPHTVYQYPRYGAVLLADSGPGTVAQASICDSTCSSTPNALSGWEKVRARLAFS